MTERSAECVLCKVVGVGLFAAPRDPAPCEGTGTVPCTCDGLGGCACHNHGEAFCPGCGDCLPPIVDVEAANDAGADGPVVPESDHG